MSESLKLIEQFARLRQKSARFYRADFHMHSPFSHDWMNGSGNPILDRDTSLPVREDKVKAYCEVCHQAGIELAAVTDHMRWSFGVKCASYTKATSKSSDLVLLPGIELSITLDVPTIKDLCFHVLAIFPEDDATSKIERIFAGAQNKTVPGEEKRTGKERLSFDSMKAVVDAIHGNGGIAIAAHIYGKHGARMVFTSKAELLLESIEEADHAAYKAMYKKVGDEVKTVLQLFDAVQVRSTTDPVHFLAADGELLIPLVLSTDAHEVSRLADAGSITWVKMAEPSFDGLVKALMFPDTRIRFPKNLPESKPPRLLGVRITGSKKHDRAFFKDLTVAFSDNLTALVGPRGSGKSALIDALRYVFGYNKTLGEVEKLKEQIVDRQTHTLMESRIQVAYETKDGSVRILSAIFDPNESYTTKVYDQEGKEILVEDVEKCGDFPLNLYGWNELELLGEQPYSQRENLDKFIRDIQDLKGQRDALYKELAMNREDCVTKARAVEEFFKDEKGKVSILRLPEYESIFNRLNTKEIRAKFEKLDDLAAKLETLRAIETTVAGYRGAISKVQVDEITKLLETVGEGRLREWLNQYVKDELKWADFRERVRQKRNEILAEVQTINERMSEKINELSTQRRKLESQIASELGSDAVISAELRNNAKLRLDKARAQLARYHDNYRTFREAIDERKKLLARLKEIKQRIFATRDLNKNIIIDKISVVQDEKAFKIDLLLNQGGDRKELIDYLASPNKIDWGGKQYKSQELPEVISWKHDPLTLGETFLENKTNELVAEIETDVGDGTVKKRTIDVGTSELLVNLNYPFQIIEEPPVTKIDTQKLEKILRLQEVRYDDEFYITLNGRPIHHCSPGQRCSAMLPIVTLTSDAPIVIDQPEDNLDNRIVSRAVFKILSRLKETRQIIVATHNPNILVSGDAELVNVLDPEGKVRTTGSIDDDQVVQDIIDLLEGGREAFERRQKRYKKHLDVSASL